MSTGPTTPMSVAAQAAQRLAAQQQALAQAVTDRLYSEMPELLAKYGERGRNKCLQDMRYNLEHLVPAVDLEDPSMFASYVVWLNKLLLAYGVPTEEVIRCLELTERITKEWMPADEAAEVARSIQAGLAVLRTGGA